MGFGLLTGFIAHLHNVLLHFTNHYIKHYFYSSPSSSTAASRDSPQFSTNFSLGTSVLDWRFWVWVFMLRPTVSRPVCLGTKHPFGAYDQIFITCVTVTILFLWGALSDERSVLSFVCTAGPCQRNLSRIQVPWDLRPYFTISDLRLPFSSPPTIRRVTVEVFDPASTRVNWLFSTEFFFITTLYEPNRKHRFEQYPYFVFTYSLLKNGFFYSCVRVYFRENLATEPLPSNEIFRLWGVMSQYFFLILLVPFCYVLSYDNFKITKLII
jgi:hypothetical protein